MASHWNTKRKFWTIVLTVLITIIGVAVAMNFAIPEKRLEHKVEHKYAIADAQFRREMGALLGPAIQPGNRVTDLENGDEIFPAMLEAIRSAQHTITFETYIYWSGEIGKRFAEALCERARAGVAVAVTIDAVGGSDIDAGLIPRMQTAGILVEQYRPLRWYTVSRLNNRTHRKLLVIDGKVGFTGGVGIGTPWEGHAQDPDHWRDIHFRIEGPVVAQMQAAFNDNWIKMTGRILNGDTYFPAIEPAGAMDANMFMSSPSGGSESMHLMYLTVIAAAVQRIDLAAAYFIPDPLMLEALLAARERGVQLRIMMPGANTDSGAVRLASKADWEPLLQAGVKMYEYDPTMLHNKLLIADGELVSVGSTNFDQRSFELNDEATLNVYDRAFAEHMTQVFEDDLKHAHPYTLEMWRNRPLSERLDEKFIRPIKSQL
ncbi:MAG TPA: phospholipase D-like domain-containing protein [Rudaea sp.]|nr:phospholipase D-like domain-containing protein [Rudaea sp.]